MTNTTPALPNLPPESDRPAPTANSGFDLPWETLDALIEGKSPVDLTLMPIKTPEEAFDLVYRYGYDCREPEDRKEALELVAEAIAFIENRFLKAALDWEQLGEPVLPVLTVPESIRNIDTPETLVLMAANAKKPERLWACAILKVLHTLVHIHNNSLLHFYQQASDCIISNFYRLLSPVEDGTFNLVDRDGRKLNLYGFETKYQKPRESILVKLLCKKETLAEDVRDLVGVRIITHQPVDAILAVDILRSQKVILFSNIIPSRSKNNLFDFERLRTQYEKAQADLSQGRGSAEDVLSLLRSLTLRAPSMQDFTKDNPSTLVDYKSIHITCRYFLRFKSDTPLAFYRPEDELMPFLPVDFDPDPFEHGGASGKTQAKGDIRLAFPYEIQLMDKESYLENASGKSAHALYKQNQLITARRRVMGPLFKYYSDKSK